METREIRKIELRDFYFGPVNLLVMPQIEIKPKTQVKRDTKFRIAPKIEFKGHQ